MLRTGLLVAIFFLSNYIQDNHPPVVKITSPKNNDVYEWGAPVRYAISVSDKEDGDSKYDEINPNEVLLEVRFVEDTANARALKSDRTALQLMMASNCMNCHAFNSKLIGPSFYDISKRYPDTKTDVENLVKHVREGSKGIWGKDIMPTHPELSAEQTEKMVKWILSYSFVQNISYYTGTQGSFRLQRPEKAAKKSGLLLTASYMDHGKVEGGDKIIMPVTK